MARTLADPAGLVRAVATLAAVTNAELLRVMPTAGAGQ
jgi:hypothetical protein